MSLDPRIPANTNSGIQNWLLPSDLSTANVARPGGALPPQMSGENIDETPILPAESNRISGLNYSSETIRNREHRYTEPDLPYGGTVNSSVWHTRHGGAYIEVSGKRGIPEFINIVHTSGTHITLDPNGSIIIKSFGDTHNVTKGNSFETSSGEKVQVHGGGYTIHVKGGTMDIRSEGNMNFSCGADMSISAAGKLTMNVGDGLDLAAARIALNARVDTLDLVSNSKTRITSLSQLDLRSAGSMKVYSESNIDVKSDGTLTTQAEGALNARAGDAMNLHSSGGQINLKSSGNINADGSNIFLNSGAAAGAPAAAAAISAIKAGVPPEIEKSVFTENSVSSSPPGHGIRGEGAGENDL
jgi:hypothetical protein